MNDEATYSEVRQSIGSIGRIPIQRLRVLATAPWPPTGVSMMEAEYEHTMSLVRLEIQRRDTIEAERGADIIRKDRVDREERHHEEMLEQERSSSRLAIIGAAVSVAAALAAWWPIWFPGSPDSMQWRAEALELHGELNEVRQTSREVPKPVVVEPQPKPSTSTPPQEPPPKSNVSPESIELKK